MAAMGKRVTICWFATHNSVTTPQTNKTTNNKTIHTQFCYLWFATHKLSPHHKQTRPQTTRPYTHNFVICDLPHTTLSPDHKQTRPQTTIDQAAPLTHNGHGWQGWAYAKMTCSEDHGSASNRQNEEARDGCAQQAPHGHRRHPRAWKAAATK